MGSSAELELLKQPISQYGQLMDLKELTSMPTTVDEAAEMVEMLTQKLVNLSSSLYSKDEQASMQTKLAREAIEARDKAKTDYVTLKTELEMILQQKKLVEGRCLQLNGALKSCVDELRHAKDQKNQEALIKKREWEKVKAELEEENSQLKSQLFEAIGEKKALSKSIQENTRTLAEINEVKARAESEVKVLQVQIDSMNKDADNFKYEIHILKKELQMRNEEKERGKKTAEATHKQHLEDVKKIARLESECQRFRGIIRQRLLCPAVIAQMKVEADHVGKKRLPTPKRSTSISEEQRKIEALEGRLLVMEDENKTLKETLTERINELKAARELCARTATKLSSSEARLEALTAEKESENNHVAHNFGKSVVTSTTNVNENDMEVMDLSLGFEEGANNDDELSSAESWASALIVQLSNLTNENKVSTSGVNLQKDHGEYPKNMAVPKEHDMQPIWNDINSKLSLIENNINILQSTVKHARDNSTVIETGYLDETVKLLLHAFSEIKHILNETKRSFNEDCNLHVMDLEQSMQVSESSTPEDFSDVEPGETIVYPNKFQNDHIGLQHVLTKMDEAFMLLLKTSSHEDRDDKNTVAEMIDRILQDTVHVTTRLAEGQVQLTFQEMIRLINQVLDLLCSQCGLTKSLGRSSDVNISVGHEDMILEIENLKAQVESMNVNQADMEKELHESKILLDKSLARVVELERELNQAMEENDCLLKEMSAEKMEMEGKLEAERLSTNKLRIDMSLLKEELQKQVGKMEELQMQLLKSDPDIKTVKDKLQGVQENVRSKSEVVSDVGEPSTEAKIEELSTEAKIEELSTEAKCEDTKLEMNAPSKEVEAEMVKLALDEGKLSIDMLGKHPMALSERQIISDCTGTEMVTIDNDWVGDLSLVPASHAPSIVRHSVRQRQSSFRRTNRGTPGLIASDGTSEECPQWISNIPDRYHQDYPGSGYVSYRIPSTTITSPSVPPLDCHTNGPVTSVVMVASPHCGGIITSGGGGRKSSVWRIRRIFSRARRQP